MAKLKEADHGYGVNLGRVIDVTDEEAAAIEAGQTQSGIVCWVPAPKNAQVTELTPPQTDVAPAE